MSVHDTEPEGIKPSKKRSLWRWLLWVLLGLFLLFVIVAGLIWLNRYSLMERGAKDLFLERGFAAELSIDSINKTQAVLKNVRLADRNSDDGAVFFGAEKITASYQWREALKGRFSKIVFFKPEVQLTLDEKGKIIDSWLPPQDGGEGGELIVPPQGIIIQDGTLTVGSPFGDAVAKVDAVYFNQDDLTTQLDIAPTTFSYGDWRMAGGGQIDIELKQEDPKLNVDVHLSSLEHPIIDATDLYVTGKMIPDISDMPFTIDGDLDFKFGSIVTAQLSTGTGHVKWTGRAERDPTNIHPLKLSGSWSNKALNVVLPDPARRKNLAQTLSLSKTLSKAPIAQNFSADLTAKIESLLGRSDIDAEGRLEFGAEGLSLSLSSPALLRGDETTLRLEQTDWAPIYNFARQENELRLAFHAALTEPVGLTLHEADLVAPSPNGWQIDGITRFSADISTSKTWRGRGLDGREARLAPFKAEAVYKGSAVPRNLLLSGGIDYDGIVPGGYVTALTTSGRMSMDVDGGAVAVRFKPENDAPILISKVETPTAWRAENLSLRLLSETPMFRRKGSNSQMDAQLSDVNFTAIDDTNSKNLEMAFGAVNVSGVLKGQRQNWDILGQSVEIRSEDMPGPGTVMTAPESRIQVQRDNNLSPMNFYMAAPEADVKTQLVNAKGIQLEAAGQPDKYELRYSPGDSSGGRVKFAGETLPRLPMTGVVNFENGAFVGTARTTLPLTDDQPIDIAYRFKDGQGTADVEIPDLRFTPKGLQPQYLVSALKGKIAKVEGLVQAKIKLAFVAGQPLQSSGIAKIIDMNFGTLPGPLTGVNTEMSFTNMFPLQSQGRQTLTVDKFDPGFPLENGLIEFEMIPDGVKIFSARWPLGDGFLSLDPFEWLYSNEENRVVMRIENVSIGEFLKDVGDGAFTATGDIEGTLPIVLSGVDVRVENGELWVKDGGVIQYRSDQLESISELDGTNERAVAAIRSGNYRDAAFEALKNFEYQELRVKIDGALDGPIDVFLKADGKNDDVLGGQPFLFNINLQGELLNILRSFNTNAQIKSELARRGLTKEAETPDLNP